MRNVRLLTAGMVFFWALGPVTADQGFDNEKIRESAQRTAAACGIPLQASIDWKTFRSADLEKYSASSYCDWPLFKLYWSCQKPEKKAAAAQKIKRVVCRFGGPGKRALSIRDGTMEYVVDWTSGNDDDFGEKWLKANL